MSKGHIVPVLIDGKTTEAIEIMPDASSSEVQSAFRAAAGISDAQRDGVVLKLYRMDGVLVPIGPHIPPTTAAAPYSLRIKEGSYKLYWIKAWKSHTNHSCHYQYTGAASACD